MIPKYDLRRNINKLALNKIKDILLNQSGMKFDDFRESIFKKRIQRRLETLQFESLSEYLLFLRDTISKNDRTEIEKIISELTVNETSFFRDAAQFKYLEEEIFPNFKKKDSIDILSAACATGEEPYSIAMSVYELFGMDTLKKINITACDIDKEALNKCKNTRYKSGCRRLKNISNNFLKKYFVKNRNSYLVNNFLKSKVKYVYLNIINDEFPGTYDIIFCKNVMMYFSGDISEKLVEKICNSIKPNGYFFIGLTEILDKVPKELKKINFKEGFVYQKRKGKYCSHSKESVEKVNEEKIKKKFKLEKFPGQKFVHQLNIPKLLINKRPQQKVQTIEKSLVKKELDILIIKLYGIIDEETSQKDYNNFVEQMNQILELNQKKIIVDLEEVEFISRPAFEKLIKVVRYLRKNNADLIVIIKNDNLRKFTSRMNLHNIISIYSKLDKALKYFNIPGKN